ncbi:MAG TPA: endolytic transglycosylase MltG, partial [Polyangia bacterium]
MKRAAKIVAGTVLALALATGGVAWFAATYPDRAAGGPEIKAQVVVEHHATLGAIARRLAAKNIINHPLWFRIYAGERGVAQKIRAGQYHFSASMTPRELLDKLVAGVPVEEVSVTIPEGKNLVEVAALLDRAGVTSDEAALEAARDPALCHALGVPGDTLEGYLFPDTYRFRRGTQAKKALTVMVRHGQQIYAALKAKHETDFERLARTYKFGDREVILMASLVEKETAQPLERPRIAGVFLNRLRLPSFVPHVLQTDPTIVYGCTVPVRKSAACKKFEGRIR